MYYLMWLKEAKGWYRGVTDLIDCLAGHVAAVCYDINHQKFLLVQRFLVENRFGAATTIRRQGSILSLSGLSQASSSSFKVSMGGGCRWVGVHVSVSMDVDVGGCVGGCERVSYSVSQ